MRFQVLRSLWSVISCLCIDKIPEVLRLTKEIFFIKVKICPHASKAAHSNMPPRLHHCVGRFAKHRPNVYAMKEGGTFSLAVVLLLPPPCPEDAVCFVVKAKVLCLGFQMRTQLEISGSVVFTTLFQNSTTPILECVQRILRRIISWTWE